MFAIFPHDGLLNSFGLSALAKADSQIIEDLKALRYGPMSLLPPVGSGAIFPNSIFPGITNGPS